MKKILVSILAVIAIYATASAEDSDLSKLTDAVYVQTSSVPAGSQQTLSVKMKNSFDVQTIQFDLYLPEGITIVRNGDDELMTASKERVKNYNFFNSSINSDGTLRLLAQATTNNIAAGEGEIATIIVKADANMALGNYQMAVKNIVLVSKDNSSTKIETVNSTITITTPEDTRTLLDETSITAPAASSGEVNVRVNRTINANEWSSICLPFAMTAEQVKAAFGNDVQLGDFTGYDTVESNGKVVGLKINFNKVTAIAANHPYVIRVSSGITQFTADNVTIAPEVEPCVEYDNGQTGKKRVVWGTFTGTYVADYVIPYSGEDVSLFLSGNKLYYASAKTKHMKAYRACFWFSDILSTTGDASAPITMSFNDATGINASMNNQGVKNEGWYTIGGVKLSAEPTQKGLYIHNGNKEVIK